MKTQNMVAVATHQNGLSEAIMPAEKDEFYAYSALFSDQRPVYALMKCKSNKSRPKADIPTLGEEANLLFGFDHVGVTMTPIRGKSNCKIAIADITVDEFRRICAEKDVAALTSICHDTCYEHSVPIAMKQGVIVAVMTDNSKYGIMLVKDISDTCIVIDACHIRI